MKAWWIAPIILLLALLAAAYWLRPGQAVFLVSLDTVRADRLGCYGYRAARTPFVDRLALKGTRFQNAMSCSSFTSASHASILTGLYPPQHGVRFLYGFAETRLKSSARTLPEMLQERGFSTAAFVSAQTLQSRVYGLNRGFAHYDEGFLLNDQREAGEGTAVLRTQRRAEQTLDACLRWLKAERPTKCFVFIHLFDAHDSQLEPPEEFAGECAAQSPSGERLRRYDSEIAWMDAQLERFFSEAQAVIGRSRVLTCVVADHGQGLGDHGYGRHGGALYQEQLRVPLVWHGPGVPAGKVVESFVRTVDIAPTVLDLLGVPTPAHIDGHSLRPMMQGGDRTDRVCYAETFHPLVRGQEALFAIIKDGRKLIFAPPSGQLQYFDLMADPAELSNLSAHDDYGDLMSELQRFDLSTARPRLEKPDAELEEAMRSLGYFDQ